MTEGEIALLKALQRIAVGIESIVCLAEREARPDGEDEDFGTVKLRADRYYLRVRELEKRESRLEREIANLKSYIDQTRGSE